MAIPVPKRKPTELDELWTRVGEINKRRENPLPHDLETQRQLMRRIKRLKLAPELVALQSRTGISGEELERKRELLRIMSDDSACDSWRLPPPSLDALQYPMPSSPSLSRLSVFSKLKDVLAEMTAPPPEPKPTLIRQIVETGEGTLAHVEQAFMESASPEIQALFVEADDEREVVIQASLYSRYRNDPAFDEYVGSRRLIVVAG